MRRIGAITIGQSPRTDVIPEIRDLLSPDVQIMERGVLDGLSWKEVYDLAPVMDSDEDGAILVSRMQDGCSVRLSENKILPLIYRAVEELEKDGAELIAMLCTGTFPSGIMHNVPVIFPQKLLYGVVPALAGKIGVVSPDKAQLVNTEARWKRLVPSVIVGSSNPYLGAEELEQLGTLFREDGAELCVLDCIGYSREMKERMEKASGLPVILPRTLLMRIVAEILG